MRFPILYDFHNILPSKKYVLSHSTMVSQATAHLAGKLISHLFAEHCLDCDPQEYAPSQNLELPNYSFRCQNIPAWRPPQSLQST